jgi:hypothetical protein
MKNHLWILLVSLLFAFQSCQETIDIEKEKKAVIAVNEEERDAYFDRNLARLEAIWVQEATSQRRFISTRLVGWNQIRENYEEDINSKEKWKEMENVSASFSNYVVNIYDNTALIYHDVQWTGKLFGKTIDNKQERIVHLVKIDGAWKIDLIIQLSVPPALEEITVKPEGVE